MARRLVQTCAALGISYVVTMVTPPSAFATHSWLSPSIVAEESASASDAAAVAMDAKGDTLLVWVQENGTNSVIEADWRPAGGAFGTPVTLSSASRYASSPVVAMDPRGDATVAWVVHLSLAQPAYYYESFVEAAWRPVGGVFTRAKTLSGENAEAPVVAMDAKGDATVAWAWNNNGFYEIVASRLAGGTFGEPTSVSGFSFADARMPAVAMDQQGDATLAWKVNRTETSEITYLLQMATQPAGASFGPPGGFSLDPYHPAVAMDSNGDTTVVWASYDAEHKTSAIEASTRTASSGGFEAPVILSGLSSDESETSAIQPQVAMDAAGDTTVAWASSEGMRITTRQAGGSFGKPLELLKGSLLAESSPVVAMDDRGDGTVVWVEGGVAGTFILGSTKPAGGTFGAPIFLATSSPSVPESPGLPVNVAMDSQGDAVSAWVSDNGTNDTVEVAGYQAEGPQLEALQTPIEGRAGATLEFSVSPLSIWSSVASTTWSWGDGSSNTSGTSVAHVFDAPGAYQVSVSATDALGNVTSATRTITIQAALANSNHASEPPPPEFPPSEPPLSLAPAKPPTKRTPATPQAVVPVFTPLFATRASTGGGPLGLLVEIAAVRGARSGDTVLVRCIAGCQRPLREIVQVRRHHNAHGAIVISPPLLLRQTTRIEVELLARGHVARFVMYRFIRTPRGVIAEVVHKGCLPSAGRPGACP